MSRRAELWEALAESADAIQAAGDEHRRAPTPQTREAAETALDEYVKRLSPVIGQVAAFRYEASLRAFQDAIDRVETLNATLNTAPSVDDADTKLWQQLDKEKARAGRAFKAAEATLDAALERAKARDNEPDETGGA